MESGRSLPIAIALSKVILPCLVSSTAIFAWQRPQPLLRRNCSGLWFVPHLLSHTEILTAETG